MSQSNQTSKAAAGSPKNLSDKQIRRIWSELKPQPLLERLTALFPSGRWSASGARVSGCCPYHAEKNPSFIIYLDRGYARCFGCEEFVANPIDLWAKIRQLSKADALNDLRQQFNVKFIVGAMSAQLDAWERNQLLKKKIAKICHDELINAIASPNNPLYAQAQSAVKYLIGTRQVPVDAIPSLQMLGVVPPLSRIYNILDKEAVDENAKRAAEAESSGKRLVKFTSLTADALTYLKMISVPWVGAIMFRLDIDAGTVGRLKLRKPDTREFMVLEDGYEETMGFFGLGWNMYRSLLGSQQKYATGVYHVEGEFDALSIMARQVKAGGPGFVVVSGGGSAAGGMLDGLVNSGFEQVYLIGDAPNKKGDQLIKSWLREVSQLRSRVFVGYDQFMGAGDPDEAVIKCELDALQRVFLDVDNKNFFITPQDWCFEKSAPELSAIDRSDIRQLIERASDWGKNLRHPYECSAFVDACEKEYGIPAHLLKRDIVSKEEDEPGFILRVVDTLSTMFTVVGQQGFDGDRRLYLWYKQGKRTIQISLADDSSVERELGTTLGPTYQLFRDRIGVPEFLDGKPGAKNLGLQKLDQAYRWYLRQALTHMAMNAPDYQSAPHKGQGIHVIRGMRDAPPTVYVVNGRDVYVGTYDEHKRLNWKATDGPVHDGIIFDVGTRMPALPYMDWIHSAADLERAYSLDPKELAGQLNHALGTGWTFKDHALTVEFLTAHLLVTTVSDAFRRKVFMGVHADTAAGKSRLLMGLIGGTDFPRIHLIAAAKGLPSYTAAGIRQSTTNSSRPLCLDEFEDEGLGDKKGRVVTETFEMFRNLNGESNTYTMGQRGGDPVVYTLNYPVFVAAINKAKRIQDANRTIMVHLKKVPHRDDPQQILIQEFGVQGLEQLKQDLAIALLPYAATLQTMYREIEIEFGQGAKRMLDQRYFEGLYPALTMMKFLGQDYRKFLDEWTEANKDAFKFGATHTDSMELFHYICTSPRLLVRSADNNHDRNYVQLVDLLATPETRAQINQTNAGLYFDEVQQILVVSWSAAVQVVLSHHPRYSRESNLFNLRDMANRAPNAVPPEELIATGVLARLKSQGIGAIPVGYLTGYRMADKINDLSGAASINVDLTTPKPPSASAPVALVLDPPKKAVLNDNIEFDG